MLPKPKAARPICNQVFLAHRRGFGLVRVPQGELRFVTDGGQERRQLAEFDLVRRKGDGRLAPGEIDQ